MAIINNRDKIQSEVPSQKYKDNYDKIFRQKRVQSDFDYLDEVAKNEKDKEDDEKVQFCNKCSSCSGTDDMCDCTCLQGDRKDQ